MRLSNRVQELEQQLADSAADRLRLRDALNEIAEMCWLPREPITVANSALATPPGDLSVLREVCAKVLEEIDLKRDAKAIRSGEWTPECFR